ncbi:hypothetical protein [Rhodoferax antarcticus]|uniref:hypothetical protein n=1 Tax=Rhodoferax antarcticus TaxID=81479 RepID=UPI000957F9F8|nr:hypothetical protein [Rhodoferax antarcticus]APW48654.1 hypothetical protein RA876_19520 [Rhodoferax antarcticus]
MNSPRLPEDILTEFDTSISGELNLDPLGLQVIWSAYGQIIFRNRISSISNDVRNYTLNLFNHAVTKALVEDDHVLLGKGLINDKAYASRGKDSIAFKQSCLIYLENVFAYAMVGAQAQEGVETVGVLGISKARRRWDESSGNPWLLFSHEARAHVLVRQNSLGVSGRYKTPLVQMAFFDSNYDYALPKSRPLWREVQKQLLVDSGPLARLKKLVLAHLTGVLANGHRVPEHQFSSVPKNLRLEFVNAFSSSARVGAYARDFWLAVTELNKGAPGALYELLNKEWMPDGSRHERPIAEVFALASKKTTLTQADKDKLENVRVLEPFLGEVDLLLGVMLSAKSQSIDDVANKWRALGRDAHTLPSQAAPIETNAAMRAQISSTASVRLDELLELARGADVRQQVERLLKYHNRVMETRGQSPWLRLLDASQLKIDVRTRPLPKMKERPLGTWVNQYYIPQFRRLLSGLRGTV